MSKNLVELKDTIPFDYKIQLDEDRDGKNWLVVEGVFQRADAKNANGRVYPRKVLEGQIKDERIVESLQKRSMLGELDHPDDGKTSLKRVSHIVTELWMEPNGDCMGRALILNNPQGEILKELFRAGCQVGISSRGSGSVRNSGDGAVVQEDFKLNTFDFVVTPSTYGAYPTPTKESAPAIEAKEEPAVEPVVEAPKAEQPTIQEYGYDDAYSDPSYGAQYPGAPSIPSAGPAVAVDATGHPVGKQTPHQGPNPQFGGNHASCCAGDPTQTTNHYREEDDMSNRGKLIEVMANHARRTERIIEAERSVAGRLLQALISRLRNVEPVVEYVEVGEDQSARVEEMGHELASAVKRAEIAEAERDQLKGALLNLKAKLAEAGEESVKTTKEVSEAVATIIRTNPGVKDWEDYLLEASSAEEVTSRYRKLKDITTNEVLEEIRSLSESTASKVPNSPDMDLFRRTQRVTQKSSVYARGVKVHEF